MQGDAAKTSDVSLREVGSSPSYYISLEVFYMYEMLLDDLLSTLETRGIDTSKLHLVEELDGDVEPHS